MANLLKRAVNRIIVRETVKGIYNVSDMISSGLVESRFPTFGKSLLNGILGYLGSLVVGFFLWCFFNKTGAIITMIICLLIAFELILRRHTYGYRKVIFEVRDRRFKSGYREDFEWRKDSNILIPLEKKHKFYCIIEALGFLIPALQIMYNLVVNPDSF